MYQVVKRDGQTVNFEIEKISAAITKAFEAQEKNYVPGVIDFLALKVTADFEPKIKDGKIAVEDIQDSVESVLIQAGYADIAKAYILYRRNREKLRMMKNTYLDYKNVVDDYLKAADWRVKENSTVTYSVGGLILSNSGAITANYWLSEVYDDEIANAHRNADIHIHDLSMLTGYCAGWSLRQLITEGLGGIPGKISSAPASHLSTLCNQMVNFLGIMQNEWAGAQAFSSFDTYLAPFVKVDNLSYKEVKQCIQSFIYGVNTPSRWGTQAPFTNITLDWTVPADLAELNCIVGGKEQNFKYKDCVKEMEMVNKAFIEIMIEGDANGRGFQYPIPTYSITRNFDWSETENNKLLFEMTAKYGTPYFSNYINSDMEPSDVRSMCCRLRLDLRELRKKSGGFFGSGESTGSIGVVTINMPRIAYLWGTQAPFTNITLDWTVPADLAELNCIVGGKEQNFKYKDCVKEMEMVNKAFIEIMIEGDANGRGFQYPIPTYSITRNFDWSETENNKLLFEMTAKYGTPYFSNYINSDMEPSDVRSMCCRLRLDLRELRKKSGGFFGSGESTGSIGVVTINMPRIAYLSANEEEFFSRLDKMMDISARSLSVKRTVVTRLLELGLYPYTKRYLGSFNNHFSTIGLVGLSEAGLNAKWIGADMTAPETQEFSKRVLNHMRERLSDYQEKYGDLYNLEATPAESTAFRLAKHDLKRYPEMLTAADPGGAPYYTNSSHLPVGYTEDIFAALDVQDELQTLYTSGTVFHAFLGEKLPDWSAAASLVRKIAENYKLPYYTLSPTYSICRNHGYIAGEVSTCCDCGSETEVYSRVTGYYRPVKNWNDGKSQEFKQRKVYDISRSNFTPHDHSGDCCCCESAEVSEPEQILLVATKTCPNCRLAAGFLDKAGIKYEKVFAEENRELCEKYDIKQAPTLIVIKNGSAESIVNVSNIRKYINSISSVQV